MRAMEILPHIDPRGTTYEEWLQVGMALHHEGVPCSVFEDWSQSDADRYHRGECQSKWRSFRGSATPVTVGTMVELARRQGWQPQAEGHSLDWEDSIQHEHDDLAVVDTRWVEDADVAEPDTWRPADELSRYLSTLFQPDEYVGYVTESWEKDGRHLPKRGAFDRTAGQLLDALEACGGDIGAVVGDVQPEVGAWIRFNPLDGEGIKDANVTSYRYALVESDKLSVERQAAIYQQLELPVAVLVHSGGHSLHAIVRIEAKDYAEYRERVDFLFKVCDANGLELDRQNRNPSRLSRMPGVLRNGNKQFLAGVNLGKRSWSEWHEYIQDLADDLPDPEPLDTVMGNLPELAPALIYGVLRQGHKLLLAGASKAGKSFMLIQLAAAVAEGRDWLGWPCRSGRVLYVNLELDRASCLHRFAQVYQAAGWEPANIANIDVWNLRGRALPMDKLTPKLIRRAIKRQYTAVIIDPIFKVLTGDENSASEMARFCNCFDKICMELGASTIYCHHHSKGSQGQKASMDRASGSGVFSRDPDALLDCIELTIDDAMRHTVENREVCRSIGLLLDDYVTDWQAGVSQDTMLVARELEPVAAELLGRDMADKLTEVVAAARVRAHYMSGWRIEGTLREFAPLPATRIWFRHPIHLPDADDLLADAVAHGEPPWIGGRAKKAKQQAERRQERFEGLDTAFAAVGIEGHVTVPALAEYMGLSTRTIIRRVGEHPLYEQSAGLITRKQKGENT